MILFWIDRRAIDARAPFFLLMSVAWLSARVRFFFVCSDVMSHINREEKTYYKLVSGVSIEKQGRTHSPPGGAPLFSSFHFSLLYHSLTPRRRSIDVLCVNIWQHLPFISHFFLSNWKDKEEGGGLFLPSTLRFFIIDTYKHSIIVLNQR